MQIQTRSVRIRRTLLRVMRAVPTEDLSAIKAVVRVVKAEKSWAFFGVTTELDPASAELTMFWESLSTPVEDYLGMVRFNLPVVRFLSDKALVGVVAHEFAHAFRAEELGRGWFEKMVRNRRAEERAADRIATGWGFGREIQTMREEFENRVYPGIERIRTRAVRSALTRQESESRGDESLDSTGES